LDNARAEAVQLLVKFHHTFLGEAARVQPHWLSQKGVADS
jgi:hypothetical protein